MWARPIFGSVVLTFGVGQSCPLGFMLFTRLFGARSKTLVIHDSIGFIRYSMRRSRVSLLVLHNQSNNDRSTDQADTGADRCTATVRVVRHVPAATVARAATAVST